MGKRDKLKSDIFRKQLAQLLKQGMSVSKAAKELGKSYCHTKRIADQIRASDAT